MKLVKSELHVYLQLWGHKGFSSTHTSGTRLFRATMQNTCFWFASPTRLSGIEENVFEMLTSAPSLTRSRKRSARKIVLMINTRVAAVASRSLQVAHVTNCSPWTRPPRSPFFQSTSWAAWSLPDCLSQETPWEKTQQMNTVWAH